MPLDFSFAMLGIAAVGLLIGIAVGCVGIGGVLLVPILTLALGIDVKHAIAAALLSYLPSGFVAVTLYARRGSVPWREARLLCLAALPAAYLGARAASIAPAPILEALIGLLLLAGGFYALRVGRGRSAGSNPLSPGLLLGLGGGTGFVSALTGAGGAFVLLPILLLLDMPVLSAIGLGQAIAIPVAGLASLANVAAGLVDPVLAGVLALTLMTGIAIGTPIAHALPQLKLRRLLGGVVIVSGVAMLLRVAAGLLGSI
ncbi:MAG TPA: sulfite exporter TauE/SafE family protein [Stellaceae bacterium]|nr:sulfite exporter TauE/SafE family protein [Stellaceae bacterium]